MTFGLYLRLLVLVLLWAQCSYASTAPIGRWTKNNTRQALAHLDRGVESGPRHDLARYLRYDPQLIDKARQAQMPVKREQKPKKWSGGADSAIEPLVEMLKKNQQDPKLTEAVEKMSEAYLRVGFGVPRRFLGLVHEGTRPLGKLLEELARALRVARKSASVQKTHLNLEEVLGKAQESHYLFTRLHKSLFKTSTLLTESEQSFTRLSPATGLSGHVALCLVQVGRAARTNLQAASGTLAQDREDLKAAFSHLQQAIVHLDKCLEKSWSKSVSQVVMADTPGALKTIYGHVHQAISRLKSIEGRGPALSKLMKVNFRSAVASIVALTSAPPIRGLSRQNMERLREACETGHGRMRSNLLELEEEHGRLIAWAKAIRGKRPQEVEIPFPPDWVLLDSAHRRENSSPIVWSPDDPFNEQSGSMGEGSAQVPTSRASSSEKHVSGDSMSNEEEPLNAEETIALERDLALLDEVERLLRPGEELVASSTTAAFVEAKSKPGAL